MQWKAIVRTSRLSGGIFVRKSGNMMKDGMLYFIRYIVWSPPSYWYWVAGTVYFALQDKANVPMYVVSSGIQNMESVSLPDGTKVQMGPGSRLTYPASFSGKTREIRLDGQAFFDVAKNRENLYCSYGGYECGGVGDCVRIVQLQHGK